METIEPTETPTGDQYNAAVAEQFRERKAALKVSFPELAKETGITLGTIKRLFNDYRQIRLSQLSAITKALGLAPSNVIDEAERRVSEKQAAINAHALGEANHLAD